MILIIKLGHLKFYSKFIKYISSRLKLLLSVWVSWVIFRTIFAFFFTDFTVFEWLEMNLVSLKFDIGMLSALVFLVNLFSFFGEKMSKAAYSFLASVSILGFLLNFFLKLEWGTIFNVRAAVYLLHPAYALENTPPLYLICSFCLLLFSYLVFSIIFEKFYFRYSIHFSKKLALFIILSPLVFLAIRGGWRIIPLKQSDAYFSKNKTLSEAAIHPVWNIGNVLNDYKIYLSKNPYQKFSDSEASKILQDFHPQDSFQSFPILNTEKEPNVVLIVLEGVSASLIAPSAPKMPFLYSLKERSYSFEKVYSAGFRTEHGLGALHSGAWSTPYHSLTDALDISQSLPSILKPFLAKNYSTMFWFGGDIEFMNTKSYLTHIGFEKIIGKSDFPLSTRSQRLGVDDSVLFRYVGQHIFDQKSKKPFFIEILTQSTHTPFDFPGAPLGLDRDKAYELSAQFLDRQLKSFIQKIDTLAHLRPLLVIITSDHAHTYPSNIDIGHPERYHIPLIVYSPNLKSDLRGQKDTLLFRQNNFPKTLFSWLGFSDSEKFPNTYSHYAPQHRYTLSVFVNGYLYQRPQENISMEYNWGIPSAQDWPKHKLPAAILQTTVEKIRGEEGYFGMK